MSNQSTDVVIVNEFDTDTSDLIVLPPEVFIPLPYFGKPADWAFYLAGMKDTSDQDLKRRKWFFYTLMSHPDKVYDPKNEIITINGISFCHFQVSSPCYRNLRSCRKSINQLAKIVTGFLNKDKTRKLWLTCQGQTDVDEGYHSQAILLFYDCFDRLTVYIQDAAPYMVAPLPCVIEFLDMVNVEMVAHNGFWGTYYGDSFFDTCFVYSHRTVAHSLVTGSIEPQQIHYYDSWYNFHKLCAKIFIGVPLEQSDDFPRGIKSFKTHTALKQAPAEFNARKKVFLSKKEKKHLRKYNPYSFDLKRGYKIVD